MIDEGKVEKAMNFLAESDHSFAREKMAVAQGEILRRRVRSRIFLVSDRKTVAEREAEAETHPDVVKADDDYCASLLAFETLRAKRQRAELVCELYRTISANQRRS